MKYLVFVLVVSLYLGFNIDSLAQELNPGDGVRISFLDITDEISGDYYIQPDGVINMPFINIIDASSKDFIDIKEQIKAGYDSLYKNPKMTIYALFRINILGEVQNPGFYYVTDIEKFTGILALAGGTTNNADLEAISIIRDNQELQLDVDTIIREGDSVTDFGLRSGDQIFIPKTWWADRGITVLISGIALIVTIVALIIK
ncbi:MAG: polysaccharide biosynthesis/export family protein [Ignavibacterium sp.]|nr:MAG: polysaccharide biosynthesis/export family protein [Ignavibacterium sp.]